MLSLNSTDFDLLLLIEKCLYTFGLAYSSVLIPSVILFTMSNTHDNSTNITINEQSSVFTVINLLSSNYNTNE